MDVRRRGGIWPGLVAVLASGSFAVWAGTRSDALDKASRIYARAQEPEALAQALRLALDHLDRRPWDAPAARIAALCLSRLDYPDPAESYYRRAGDLGLDDSLVRAYAIVRSNARERAIDACTALAQRWPNDPRPLRILGGIYMSRRQYNEALDVATRLIAVPGGAIDGHRMAGTLQHKLETPEAAVAELEAVLRLDPELKSTPSELRSDFFSMLASDLLAMGQAERAVECLGTELALRGDPVLRTWLGKAYYQLGDFEKARQCWERSIEVDPQLGVSWLELGRLALSENRLPEARAALETAQGFAPTDSEVLFSLRNVYQRLGLRDEAEAIRQRENDVKKRSAPTSRGMGARSTLTDPDLAPEPAADSAPADRGTSNP
jgi:tetratricopeptide (TPR) repeat protein